MAVSQEQDPEELSPEQELAAMRAQALAKLNLPDTTKFFLKHAEDSSGSYVGLIASDRAIAELGGAANVQRIFESTVQDTHLIFVVTKKELDYAESDAFRKDGETPGQARVRYLDETFGAALGEEFQKSRPEEKEAFWKKYLQQNANYPLKDGSFVHLDTEDFLKSFPVKGSRQQVIDFLFAHELDHGDNSDEKSSVLGARSETLSDVAGIKAATNEGRDEPGVVSRDEFTRSVIATRVKQTIDKTLVMDTFGSSFGLRTYLFKDSHDTGFFIDPVNLDNVTIPENAGYATLDFEKLIKSKKDLFTESIVSNVDLPHTPEDMLKSNDLVAMPLFILTAQMIDEIESDGDQETEEYKAEIKRIMNLPGEEMVGEGAKFVRALNDKYPQLVSMAFYTEMYSDIDKMLKDPTLSPAQSDAYKQELEYLQNVEDEELKNSGLIDFMKRFIDEHPDIYERAMAKNLPGFIEMYTFLNDQPAWDRAVSAMTLKVYQEGGIQDPNTKRGIEIYLQEQGLLPKPEPKPAAQPVLAPAA